MGLGGDWPSSTARPEPYAKTLTDLGLVVCLLLKRPSYIRRKEENNSKFHLRTLLGVYSEEEWLEFHLNTQ